MVTIRSGGERSSRKAKSGKLFVITVGVGKKKRVGKKPPAYEEERKDSQ